MLSASKEMMLPGSFWVGLITLFLVLVYWVRFRGTGDGLPQTLVVMRAFLSNFLVLAFLASLAAIANGVALYMSYVAPWDIMQDIVSAQQLLRGESPYPANMKALMETSLQAEPPRVSLGKWIPQLKHKEQWETRGYLNVQAHPPHLILLILPFVALFGVHTTVLVVNLISLSCLFLILLLARRALKIRLSRRLAAVFLLAFLGWWPVVSLLRQGQSGLLVAAPIVLAWFYLRRGHQALAGIALAIATCLKLYPALLLVYLLFRYPRALAAAVISLVVLAGLPLIWVYGSMYSVYFCMTYTVMRVFGGDATNISVLGVLRKSGLAVSESASATFAIVAAGSVAWLILRKPGPAVGMTFDFEYATFMVLMLLLSPIAWDHYLPVLILPVVILGNWVVNQGKSWRNIAAFVLFTVAISIPVGFLMFEMSDKPWVVKTLGRSIPTVTLLAVTFWMIRLLRRSHVSATVIEELSDSACLRLAH